MNFKSTTPYPLRDGWIPAGLIHELPHNLVMAELGSYAGDSAAMFMDSGKVLRLVCVDIWENYPATGYTDVLLSDYCDMQLVEKAFDTKMRRFSDRVVKIKNTTAVASTMFPDGYFDFVYIDGDHRYAAVRQDIELWLPKIKLGGLIGGHDYVYPPHAESVQRAVRDVLGDVIPVQAFPDGSWLRQL